MTQKGIQTSKAIQVSYITQPPKQNLVELTVSKQQELCTGHCFKTQAYIFLIYNVIRTLAFSTLIINFNAELKVGNQLACLQCVFRQSGCCSKKIWRLGMRRMQLSEQWVPDGFCLAWGRTTPNSCGDNEFKHWGQDHHFAKSGIFLCEAS